MWVKICDYSLQNERFYLWVNEDTFSGRIVHLQFCAHLFIHLTLLWHISFLKKWSVIRPMCFVLAWKWSFHACIPIICLPNPWGKEARLPGNITSSQLYAWTATGCDSWREPIVLMKNVIKILYLTLSGCILACLFRTSEKREVVG